MKLNMKKAATSQLVEFFIPDSSLSTGAGKTGLAFNTASLVAYYYRSSAATSVAIPLATMTLGTWVSGGFIEIDATNMPGMYQLGIPNAALTAGVSKVIMMLKGANNMAPVAFEIQLTLQDPDLYAQLDAITHTGAVIPTVTNVTNDVGITQVGADKVWGSTTRAITAGVTVTTNNDKTGYALTSGERDSVADALLNRDMLTNTAVYTNRRSPANALRLLLNKWSITGTTITVYKEDDTTSAWTGTTTESVGANPISATDPV